LRAFENNSHGLLKYVGGVSGLINKEAQLVTGMAAREQGNEVINA